MPTLSPSALTLKSYHLMRWCCFKHGYFETRTEERITPKCPECEGAAWLVEECRGMTSEPLPAVSRPRKFIDPEIAKWQVTNSKGITGRARLNPKSIRSGKSTGRPRKTPRPPVAAEQHKPKKDETARLARAAFLKEHAERAQFSFVAALVALEEIESCPCEANAARI
ncbi:MAG: hypothetical protein ACLQLH_03585 [Terracidiphilus sp.]